MKDKPKTRTEASQPEEVEELSTNEQEALEASAEAEHSTGQRRENLIRHAEEKTGDAAP